MPRLRIKMKSLTWCGAIVLALASAAAAMAQLVMPQVPGFSNNYPWFNEVSQYQGNQSFQWFLANHPNISGILARNPGLLYDASWRAQVPALQQYMANHPYEWQSLNGQNWAEGPAETRLGDYDDQHQWRDAYWWHRNNPNRFYDNHDQWASLDSRWRAQDGDYDQQHKWHYGEWWYNQNPNWVAAGGASAADTIPRRTTGRGTSARERQQSVTHGRDRATVGYPARRRRWSNRGRD
jgi:hypothetical protein